MSPPLPWLPAHLAETYEAIEASCEHLTPSAVVSWVEATAEAHSDRIDRSSIVLYAGTNVMNPRARVLLAATWGARPSMGYPGAKYQTGTEHMERVEVLTALLARRIFRARFAETRLQSGSLANLAVYTALAAPGDTIMVLPENCGGHTSHHLAGVAGVRGLKVAPIPFDPVTMNIDMDGFEQSARRLRPRLVIAGASLWLFPFPLREMSAICEETGATLVADLAHTAGLVAGRCFQDPLREGAHVLTMSTYKSFGGPPGAIIVADDPVRFQAIDGAAYPGLTANYDAGRLGALALAQADVLALWPRYAAECQANARQLGEALAAAGFKVVAAELGYTRSHHLALDVRALGGGHAAAARLAAAGIMLSAIGLPADSPDETPGGLRIGVQEATRWGMAATEMEEIAMLMRSVLLSGADPVGASQRARELKQRFVQVQYCLDRSEVVQTEAV